MSHLLVTASLLGVCPVSQFLYLFHTDVSEHDYARPPDPLPRPPNVRHKSPPLL